MKKKEMLWQERIAELKKARTRIRIIDAYNTLVHSLIETDAEIERSDCSEVEKILKRKIQEEAWRLLFHKDFTNHFSTYDEPQ
jgi:uncharacterized protein YdcH (DUF465 family)